MTKVIVVMRLQNTKLGLLLLAIVLLLPSSTVGQEDGDPTEQERRSASPAVGHKVRIPLPLTHKNVTRVRSTLDLLVEKAPVVNRPEDRMVVVLDFDIADGKTGRGSELESCMSLARYIASIDRVRVKTVAYLPGPKNSRMEDGPATTQLNGHPVLVAISAGQLVMDSRSKIGLASIDEPVLDDLVPQVYRSIASKRLTLPVEIVMSMVDPSLELFRVTTETETIYAFREQRDEMEAAAEVKDARTFSAAGEAALYDATELNEYRLVRTLADSKSELARTLRIDPNSLQGESTLGRDWSPVHVKLPAYIDNHTAQWVIRALQARKPNLIILEINSTGADPDATLLIAQHMADYDPDQIRSVAFVNGVARGPAAMLALTCDQLVMSRTSELGGPADPAVDENVASDFRPLVRELSAARGRDWSLMMSMLDPTLDVMRFKEKSSAQQRLLSSEEVDELGLKDELDAQAPLAVDEGLDASVCENLSVSETLVEDIDGIRNDYQLDELPPRLEPTLADRWLKDVASFLGSPTVAPLLLFGAVFFISTEMSAPGIGVPGFLGTVCLILFFWSQHFGGNAHWLEIMLFVAGVVFVAMELFVIPGFGVFGIGGFLMIVISIILASQTFIIPTNSAQLARVPLSILPVLGAGMGFLVALVVLRNVLPNTPYFRRMMLKPPLREESELGVQRDPEAMVDWSDLEGRGGKTITRLAPSGKARIAGKIYDVISDGRMIGKNEEIEVATVTGNRVVVRPMQS